jgi:hypothetical protein
MYSFLQNIIGALILFSSVCHASTPTRMQVKNNTGSVVSITDIGRDVAASATESIDLRNAGDFAGSANIDTLINSNTLDIILDGVTLSNDDAKELLHSFRILKILKSGSLIGRDVTEIDSDNLTITSTGSGKVKINSATGIGGSGGFISFWNDGGTENKWLRQENNHTEPSGPFNEKKRMPYIWPFAGKVNALTFIVKNEPAKGANVDIEIYRNYSLIFTWQVRNRKWASKSNGLTSLTFAAGDRLAVFAKKVNDLEKADSVVFNLFYTFTDNVQQEIGGTNP